MIIGALAILLLALGILAFPLFYDPDAVKQFLLKQVEQQLGRKIEVGQARLEVFPRIRLELSRVTIRDVDPSQVFFTADRLDLVLRAYSLLRQQVVGKRLAVDHPRLHLHRAPDGRWNFEAAPKGESGEGTSNMGDPLGLLFRIRETVLSEGEIVVVDEFRPDGPRTLTIDGLDARLSVDPRGQQADLDVEAGIAAPDGRSPFVLSGQIAQREPSVKVAPDEPTGPMLTFEGSAEAKHLDLHDLAEFFGPRPVPGRIRGKADLQGQISVVPGIIGYDMVLSNLKADIEGLSIGGHASLSGLMAAQPTFSVTFTSSPVTIEDMLTRFPVQWLPAQLQEGLREREIGGTIQVTTATVTGATTPEPRFSLTGEFQVKNGRLVVGSDRTLIHQVSGTIFVEPDRVRVVELSGAYGPFRITAGKALVSPLELDPWLDLEVRGDVPAADLMATLSKSITIPQVARAFGELSDVKGQSQVSVAIGGPLKNADSVKIIRAEVIARDVWLRSPLLPERVVDLNGRFLYSKTGIEFDKLGGRLGRVLFELGGGISFGEPSVYQDFTIRTRGDVMQLLRLASLDPLGGMTWQGVASGAVTLGGPLKSPRIKSVIDVRETEFVLSEWFHKPAGAAASMEFEGAWLGDALLSVDRLELVLPPFRFATKGKVRVETPLAIDATFVSGPVSVGGLPPGITLGPLKDGIIEVSLDVKGRGTDWRAWQIGGWVALTDGLVTTKGAEQTLTDLYLRLKIMRSAAEIKRLAFKIKDSDVRMTGTVRNWNRNPLLNVDIESAQLDLDLLIPKGKRSPMRDFLESFADTGRVTAQVSLDRGVYKTIALSGLSCRLMIRNNTLDIDRISADTDDGHLGGRMVIYLPKEKAAEVDVSFRVSGLPFEKLMQLTGDESRLMTGRLSASGNLRANEADPAGFLHSVEGKIEFLIEDGRIRKGKVVPKIITILNLPTLLQGKVDLNKDGFPFDKVIGSLSLSNGVITEDNLVIDSPVMKMSAAGHYEIATDRVNGVVVVSPFGSYSQLLKSIPLFGKLFKGEREGTALFEVKGPLKDPDVNYLPLRSLAKSMTGLAQLAFDMLRNTIMLPKEIVSPADESTTETSRAKGRSEDRPEPRLP